MENEIDKKTKRYTGTMKYLDEQGVGYIVPDMEVFVSPSSLSSDAIREGDRVEFGIKFNESNPQFEAIDVVPIKIKCFNCRKYGHSTRECRQGISISRVKFSKCYRCGLIGHYARDCHRETSPQLSNGRRVSRSVEGTTSNSIVSVKRREDVKKVEKVEDCFILEFNPAENDNAGADSKKGDDDDCEVLNSIVCVKNAEDVKKVEEVEDCFILEFDPNEPVKFSNLSLCDNSEDVSVLAEKGQVACRDYPHPRHLCATHPFQTTPHEIHCKMCYCYVCEKPAPCKRWTEGYYSRHCNATADSSWNRLTKTEEVTNQGEKI